MSEIEALLGKADRSFASAKRILEDGDADFAASRAYYGYFYVAEALLLSQGLNFSRHGQVIAQYGLRFTKPEILDRRFHQLFNEAFSLRQTVDYSTEPPPDAGTVRTLIEGGEDFLREARIPRPVNHPSIIDTIAGWKTSPSSTATTTRF